MAANLPVRIVSRLVQNEMQFQKVTRGQYINASFFSAGGQFSVLFGVVLLLALWGPSGDLTDEWSSFKFRAIGTLASWGFVLAGIVGYRHHMKTVRAYLAERRRDANEEALNEPEDAKTRAFVEVIIRAQQQEQDARLQTSEAKTSEAGQHPPAN